MYMCVVGYNVLLPFAIPYFLARKDFVSFRSHGITLHRSKATHSPSSIPYPLLLHRTDFLLFCWNLFYFALSLPLFFRCLYSRHHTLLSCWSVHFMFIETYWIHLSVFRIKYTTFVGYFLLFGFFVSFVIIIIDTLPKRWIFRVHGKDLSLAGSFSFLLSLNE